MSKKEIYIWISSALLTTVFVTILMTYLTEVPWYFFGTVFFVVYLLITRFIEPWVKKLVTKKKLAEKSR
jgi:hypothetical protein